MTVTRNQTWQQHQSVLASKLFQSKKPPPRVAVFLFYGVLTEFCIHAIMPTLTVGLTQTTRFFYDRYN